MNIPDFQSLMLPVLQAIADGLEHPTKELTAIVSDRVGLDEEERAKMLPSGQARVIVNRVHWAKLYLEKAGLLRTVRRGVVVITDVGQQVLRENPARINMQFLERFPSYVAFRDNAKSVEPTNVAVPSGESTKTPEELIEESFKVLREALAADLLAQVAVNSDKFFERLVVELLVAMGYGGSIEDAGKAVGKSGDGGIDGVIKEDKLGLDVVVIQAKRWNGRPVGRPDLQSFAGSMEAYRAHKGVFITTSTFSEQAKEYVRQIQRKIVLIDGTTLANFMIEHDVGVAPHRSYTVKRMDTDFFEE